MAAQKIALELPEEVAKKLADIGRATGRSLEEVAVQTIVSNLQPDPRKIWKQRIEDIRIAIEL